MLSNGCFSATYERIEGLLALSKLVAKPQTGKSLPGFPSSKMRILPTASGLDDETLALCLQKLFITPKLHG